VVDLRPALGRKVRELRDARGLSQEQLAERASMHWTYISGIERGRRNPGLNALAQLAGALGVTLVDLLRDLKPTKALSKSTRAQTPPRSAR
jgi:transcriptional regulator with XRE-family HTH domain